MSAYIILAAAALCIGAPAVAQNTKGTGAETATTTRTNPIGTSINTPPPTANNQDKPPNAPINRGNASATQESQSLGDPKKGLLSK